MDIGSEIQGVAQAGGLTKTEGDDRDDDDDDDNNNNVDNIKHKSVTVRPSVALPLCNFDRVDISLRQETLELFAAAGIPPSDLTPLLPFKGDIDLKALHSEGRLRLTLVDHNRLDASLAPLADSVIQIIDHHRDVGLYTERVPKGTARRRIAFNEKIGKGVGSCCTLVAQEVRKMEEDGISMSQLGEDKEEEDEDDQDRRESGGEDEEETSQARVSTSNIYDDIPTWMATLLLGVVLLDTHNLSPQAGKVTPEDEEVAKALYDPAFGERIGRRRGNDRGGGGGGEVERIDVNHNSLTSISPSEKATTLFEHLQEIKFSEAFWKGLTPMQMLRFDYKQFTVVAKDQIEGGGDEGGGGGGGKGRGGKGRGGDRKVERGETGGGGGLPRITYGIASVLLPLPEVISLADMSGTPLVETMCEFARQRGLDVMAMNALYLTPEPQRQVLLFSPPSHGRPRNAEIVGHCDREHNQHEETEEEKKEGVERIASLAALLVKHADGKVIALPAQCAGEKERMALLQVGSKVSRKRLVPLFDEYLASHLLSSTTSR